MSGLSQKNSKFKTLDEAFSDLSVMLHTYPQSPTYNVDFLKSEKLDYSVKSLKHIDNYLNEIRKNKEVEKDWNKTVLRVGAYVGEVIRRSDEKGGWHWVDHDTALELDPIGWKDFEKSLFTCAVLYQGGKSFCFPLGKVYKFIENGREDSVRVFARVIIDKWKAESV